MYYCFYTLEISQFRKSGNSLHPFIPLLGIYVRERKAYVHTKTCTQMFIASSFIFDSQKLGTTQISINRWKDKQLFWATLINRMALRNKNKLTLFTCYEVAHLKIFILNKEVRHKNSTYYRTPFILNSINYKLICSDRKQISCWRQKQVGKRGGREGGITKVQRGSFVGDKYVNYPDVINGFMDVHIYQN